MKFIKILFITSMFAMLSIAELQAQSHTFSTFNAGTLTSGTTGLSTSLNTGTLTKKYFVFSITADFVGTGNVAWSNSIQAELNNGGGTIYKDLSGATTGAAANENATTLVWTGIMKSEYVGGSNLTVRFFDDYDDASGPYTSEITNVKITIYEAGKKEEFPTYSPGTLASNTAGISTAMPTGALTGKYLLFKITADFVGTGNVAWSNSIQTELNNGGATIYKDLSFATSGAADNPNATTLTWTGVMKSDYQGGGGLTLRFFDDYDDASGPYTSDITNVNLTIYETSLPHSFATYSPGTLASNTAGLSMSLNTAGIPAGDYLLYTIEADFVGTGNVAWSNSIQTEVSNGGGAIYKDLSFATSGSATNPNATTLLWTGFFNANYVGGDPITLRFFDDYDDASGPYTSDITNVKFTLYKDGGIALPVELLSFDAKKMNQEKVKLDWVTLSEVNNDFFTIERSADGRNFSPIARVEGNGTSIEKISYSTIDSSPLIGDNYYRLKQTDFNGKHGYSDVEMVKIAKKIQVSSYPNPSTDVFTISFPDDDLEEEKLVLVFDVLGRLVTEIDLNKTNNVIDLSKFPDGLYLASFKFLNTNIKLVKKS